MTEGERLAERDMQKHESQHSGCNERYWRDRFLQAEAAATHFFRCEQCRKAELCPEGSAYAAALHLVT